MTKQQLLNKFNEHEGFYWQTAITECHWSMIDKVIEGRKQAIEDFRVSYFQELNLTPSNHDPRKPRY